MWASGPGEALQELPALAPQRPVAVDVLTELDALRQLLRFRILHSTARSTDPARSMGPAWIMYQSAREIATSPCVLWPVLRSQRAVYRLEVCSETCH